MKRRSRVRWIVGAAAGVALVVAGGTAAYASYYADRAVPGTVVAGVPVGGKSPAQVRSQLEDRVRGATVHVSGQGLNETVPASALGASVDVDATLARAFAPNARVSERIAGIFDPQTVEPVVKTDPAALRSSVARLDRSIGVQAHDASVRLDAAGTGFEVVPAQTGRAIDQAQLARAARTAADTLAPTSATVRLTESKPQVSDAQAQQVAQRANAVLGLGVVVSDGSSTYSPDAATKASWVRVTSTDEGLSAPAVDQKAVATWVDSTASGTNRDPVDGVRNVTKQGKVVAVAVQKTEGWKVKNAQAVTSGIVKSLESGTAYSGKFAYTSIKAGWKERQVATGAEKLAYQASEGEKWIDVDLSKYTVTAYVGASKVYGPVPMVPGAPGTETVTGTYHVYLKYRTQTMRGTNLDGTKYVSPDVPWIMYFHESYGLHGAPWRSSFGWGGPGGSHGCVNMPVASAKWLFEWAPMGTTVVSHK